MISADTYTTYGLPWFDLYDEDLGDLDTSKSLAGVKSVDELAKEKGELAQDGASVEVAEGQVSSFGE
jgi:hypothetical protein